jgi:hypothetical protein
MSTLAVVFLGIIAVTSLVQSAFLIGLMLEGRKLSKRVNEMQDRIEREIKPSLDNVARVTENLATVSDLAVLQARRVDGLLADTIEKVEETTTLIRKVVLRPIGPLVDIAAFLKGIRRGIEVYQQLRGFDQRERVPRRGTATEDDDEHLFI